MGYRGQDLDLHTAEQARGRTSFRASPYPLAFERGEAADALPRQSVLVDDAVLLCCNHAYDIAVAHRAPEVALEHLLNAMTRTDAAAAVLATNGIDVAGLRHDTAALIADHETMLSGAERRSPRRSQDLADVLQWAADTARSRRAPVDVANVLQALFELNREQPGLNMLKRNAPGWQPRPMNEAVRPDQLPPLGTYQVDPRYVQTEMRPAEAPAREWVRVQQPAYYPAAQSGYYVAEAAPVQLPAQTYYVAEPSAPAPTGTVTDAVQNSRIEQLERTLREISGELSAERKAFSQLVGELKREGIGQTETTSRQRVSDDERIEHVVMATSPQTAERLVSLERNVDAKFADLARGWTALGERLQSLEMAVTSDRPEGGLSMGLMERLQGLDGLGRTLSTLSERMAGLERQIANRPTNTGVSVNLQPLIDRLDAMEQAQQLRPAATTAALAPVLERLSAIERSIANRAPITTDLSPVVDRLQAMELRIAETGRGVAATTERTERLSNQQAERLRAIEEAMVVQRGQVTQLASNLTADVKSLGQSVTQSLNAQSDVGDRFQTLVSSVDRQRTELANSVVQPLGEKVGQVTALVEAYRNDATGHMMAVSERLVAVEKQMQAFGQRTL
jgi:hypothetical protein